MKFHTERIPLQVLCTYIAVYEDHHYQGEGSFFTRPKPELLMAVSGILGDRHCGHETEARGGVCHKGSPTRNNTQWSAICPAEVARINDRLGLDQRITPELLGINLLLGDIENARGIPALISGIALFSHIVISPHDAYKEGRFEDTVLVAYETMLPCKMEGREIAKAIGVPDVEDRYLAAAKGIRGIAGWVQQSGTVRPGHHAWILTPTGD